MLLKPILPNNPYDFPRVWVNCLSTISPVTSNQFCISHLNYYFPINKHEHFSSIRKATLAMHDKYSKVYIYKVHIFISVGRTPW